MLCVTFHHAAKPMMPKSGPQMPPMMPPTQPPPQPADGGGIIGGGGKTAAAVTVGAETEDTLIDMLDHTGIDEKPVPVTALVMAALVTPMARMVVVTEKLCSWRPPARARRRAYVTLIASTEVPARSATPAL